MRDCEPWDCPGEQAYTQLSIRPGDRTATQLRLGANECPAKLQRVPPFPGAIHGNVAAGASRRSWS